MTETERVTGAGPDPTVVIFLWLLLPALWVVAHGSKLISWLFFSLMLLASVWILVSSLAHPFYIGIFCCVAITPLVFNGIMAVVFQHMEDTAWEELKRVLQ